MKHAAMLFILALLFSACSSKHAKVNGKYYDIKECNKELSLADDINEDERIDKIVVKKSKHKLYLYREGKVVETLPISLGKNPNGDKIHQGDNRTPEGEYWIRRKLCSKKYYRSLCISYPNPNDIQQARSKGMKPGGDITIHAQPTWNADGSGNSYTLSRNWTQGCVAVTNEGMEKLWYAVREGVPIVIEK
jgi:murein L,D-transpeptidase YafK